MLKELKRKLRSNPDVEAGIQQVVQDDYLMKLFIAQLRKIVKWVSLQESAGAAALAFRLSSCWEVAHLMSNDGGYLGQQRYLLPHALVLCQQHTVCTCSLTCLQHYYCCPSLLLRLKDKYSEVENVRGKKRPLVRPVVSE
jgi:hypothetical protein